jgi:D-inositol-3-phosphate glycosyltransferase
VVHQAVNLQRFSPGPVDQTIRRLLTDDPDGFLVGIVGRIDPMKGVDVLIRAMALLAGRAASARLVVVGSPGLDAGEYEDAVKKDAERLLGQRVRFVGPRSDVPQVLRALDVLVNASAAEPFGLIVLEAQACGVPVVAPSSGGIPDFVTDGDNGLLVPPGDPASLARALESLLSDASLRERLGRRGRETAVAKHGLDLRVARLAQIYRTAARRERVPCER